MPSVDACLLSLTGRFVKEPQRFQQEDGLSNHGRDGSRCAIYKSRYHSDSSAVSSKQNIVEKREVQSAARKILVSPPTPRRTEVCVFVLHAPLHPGISTSSEGKESPLNNGSAFPRSQSSQPCLAYFPALPQSPKTVILRRGIRHGEQTSLRDGQPAGGPRHDPAFCVLVQSFRLPARAGGGAGSLRLAGRRPCGRSDKLGDYVVSCPCKK
eukprot:1176038-Prorocentrum_minimum.AAC.1